MTCKKRKVCWICEAPFKMERGCSLEKRCPACRLIYGQSSHIKHYHRDIYVPSSSISSNPTVLNDIDLRLLEAIKPTYLMPINNYEELFTIIGEYLTDREYYSIYMLYVLEYSYTEIGNVLNKSSERIRQMHSQVLYKLKHPKVGMKILKAFNIQKGDL